MDAGRHPNITLFTLSEVKEVKGEAGNFSVKILKHPRYVNITQCTACGDCAKVCPIVVPNEFDLGLKSRKAIFTPFSQAVPSAYVRIKEDCLDNLPERAKKIMKRVVEKREGKISHWELIVCGKCIKTCKAKCINFDEPEEEIELSVAAIIVTTGVEYYDPREASEYGYTRFENVITSFELERLLSASGPSQGALVRFTDRRPPKRVAFINCVGSRNMRWDIPFCSRICCMNAIKDSLIIREYFPDAEIYIFYIDIRAFGKGFEELYNRSLEAGVKYIKGKPSKVIEDLKTKDLLLLYEDQIAGKIEWLQVDVVVLSSAIIPSWDSKELAQILGIELSRDGYFKQKDSCAYPLESTKSGIFLAGGATGPKDITDSIAEASGVAAKASLLIREKAEQKKEEIPEMDISGAPRIGVFVCHCGTNIAGLLSCESLAQYARTLKNVVFSEDLLFSCAQSSQQRIQEKVKEYNLNRVVVAACTPKTHEPIFQETLSKIGFNPYLFELVNIRDQCSWVHQQEPEAAFLKAKDLIRMAVARARLLAPLNKREMKVGQDVLVIGGGISGIQVAIDLVNRGFKVYLIEKDNELGGRVKNLASVYPSGQSGVELISRKIKELENKGITIFTNSDIKDIKGFVGNFEVELNCSGRVYSADDEITRLKAGAIVLAIGADLYKPLDKFGYGQYPNVWTSMELEEMLLQNSEKLNGLKSVAFIQCVGSRAEFGNTWCSRFCCQAAIKQAILLRQKGIDVTVFHRGIRVYSKGAEMMYRQAREMGVLFIPYSELAKGEIPEVIGDRKAEKIEMYLDVIDKEIVVPVDAVILSVGMVPSGNETMKLSDLLKVSRGSDLFFLERHSKFGPVETTVEGVFLAGCCQFPQDIADSIAQASAVASRVAALLSKGMITLEPIVSSVDEALCRGCARCAEICEFKAIEITKKEEGIYVARVNEALCKGCGSCCAICPTGAIDLRHFKSEQVKAQLEALLG